LYTKLDKPSAFPITGKYGVGFKDNYELDKNVFISLFYPINMGTYQDKILNNQDIASWARYGKETINAYKRIVPFSFLLDIFGHMSMDCVTDEKPSNDFNNRKIPVVIFSHGLFADRTCYSSIARDLASNGILVVTFDHLDGSAAICVKNGEKYLAQHEIGETWNEKVQFRKVQLTQRSDEVKIRVDLLYKLKKIQFTNKISLEVDTDKMVVFGHSFGGATSIRYSIENPSYIKGVVAWDPWVEVLDYETRDKEVKIPALIINSATFKDRFPFDHNGICKSYVISSKANGNANSKYYDIDECEHMHQTDFSVYYAEHMRVVRAINNGKGKDIMGIHLALVKDFIGNLFNMELNIPKEHKSSNLIRSLE